MIDQLIEKALLDKAAEFAGAQSPALTVATQNGLSSSGGPFAKPTASKTATFLRAAVLPAPARVMGISFTSHVQHYGLLQIDVVMCAGSGTEPMNRVVSAIRDYFPLGLEITEDDVTVQINSPSLRAVARGPLLNDDPGWVKIPVSIPWMCFHKPA